MYTILTVDYVVFYIGDMLKYALLLYLTPVINGQLPEGRITTFGSAEEDDYPSFRTHNFTVYEDGGFTLILPCKHMFQIYLC